jgi:hypothetical protein
VKIQSTPCAFQFDIDSMIALKETGVSDAVLGAMLDASAMLDAPQK